MTQTYFAQAKTCYNQKIDLVKVISFLGVILDEHLIWKSHISHVARKMAKSIGIIKKAFEKKESLCLSKSSLTIVILFSCLSIYAILHSSLGLN